LPDGKSAKVVRAIHRIARAQFVGVQAGGLDESFGGIYNADCGLAHESFSLKRLGDIEEALGSLGYDSGVLSVISVNMRSDA
jgi:hypothetical protein